MKQCARREMCRNNSEENKRTYKSVKNRARKAVSKAVREKAEEVLSELQNCPNWMFGLVKGLKIDSKEVDGGRCMRGSNEKLCFSEKERHGVWKDYMERIMDEENDWAHNLEGDAIEGQVFCVSREVYKYSGSNH